jgi:hypothetical protein
MAKALVPFTPLGISDVGKGAVAEQVTDGLPELST